MTFSKQNGTISESHLLFFLSNNSLKTVSREASMKHFQWNCKENLFWLKYFSQLWDLKCIGLTFILQTVRSISWQDHLAGEYQGIKQTFTSLRIKVSVTNKSMSQQYINGKWERRDCKAVIIWIYWNSGHSDAWKMLSGNNNSLYFGLDRLGSMASCLSFQGLYFIPMENVEFTVSKEWHCKGDRKSVV